MDDLVVVGKVLEEGELPEEGFVVSFSEMRKTSSCNPERVKALLGFSGNRRGFSSP
jgi:hypothetical protein